MTETVLVCRPCLEHGRGERQPVQVAIGWDDDDGWPRAWEWRCPLCDAIVSFVIDGGTLDLDEVRRSQQLNPSRVVKVELFYKPDFA